MSARPCLAALFAAVTLTLAPAATSAAQEAPAIVEIRVHGNHSTPDAEVITLSGLAVGQSSAAAQLTAARERLEASGRFESVSVRPLARSIDVPDDIMVMLLVEERAGATPDLPRPGWMRRTATNIQWLPALRYEEGYGFTYGLQVAMTEFAGRHTRLTIPATWGGERRLGAELEYRPNAAVLSAVTAGAELTRTVHPAFDVPEERARLTGRLERRLATSGGVVIDGGRDRVTFAGRSDDVTRVGAELFVDTRLDPSFPRNAVWGRASIERLDVVTGVRRRTRLDTYGALGLPFKAALTGRVFQVSSDGSLPPYEQTMIGGILATRGYRRGYRVGDNAVGASLSLARPFGSPLNSVRTGLRVFVDWAGVYDAGTKWQDASIDRGMGVGWFANLVAVNAYVDVGRNQDGRWRVHVRFGTGF